MVVIKTLDLKYMDLEYIYIMWYVCVEILF